MNNQEKPVHFNRIRPRFKFEVPHNAREINQQIRKELDSGQCNCTGTTTDGFAYFCPKQKDRHFWSPQLTLTIEETENGSIVRGLYGPQPSVWTMFVFIYSAIGFLFLISLLIFLSYWSLGIPSPFSWITPLLLVLFMSIYLVAYFGQKLGQKQMTNLHRMAERCFSKDITLS